VFEVTFCKRCAKEWVQGLLKNPTNYGFDQLKERDIPYLFVAFKLADDDELQIDLPGPYYL
jgi:hypothetical protein